jgi:hypothetical protein
MYCTVLVLRKSEYVQRKSEYVQRKSEYVQYLYMYVQRKLKDGKIHDGNRTIAIARLDNVAHDL